MIKLLNPMHMKIYARWYFHKATLVKKIGARWLRGTHMIDEQ